jgi:thiopeptide-type bacteriocin biosynthesis protein
VAPVVEGALASGAADRWFFLRYRDPDFHLRLRFHGQPERLRQEVQPALEAAVQRNLGGNGIWKLQLDSYDREIERYGGEEALLLSEELFSADSQAVLDIVRLGAGDPEVRWRLALVGIDMLLEDLGFELSQRHALVSLGRERLASEFAFMRRNDRLAGERFRQHRAALEALLDRSPAAEAAPGAPFAAGLAHLSRRSQRLRPIGLSLREASRQGRLSRPLLHIADSYLHMFVNRLVPSAATLHELVLCDFLRRLYDGRLARATRARDSRSSVGFAPSREAAP